MTHSSALSNAGLPAPLSVFNPSVIAFVGSQVRARNVKTAPLTKVGPAPVQPPLGRVDDSMALGHVGALGRSCPTALSEKRCAFEEFFKANNFMNPARKVQLPPDVTFNDVAGVDEAKMELMEIVSFLQEPKRFTDIGAKLPKGVMLAGPPGTGKTLLAKAVAGEAKVPFYSATGSQFVEMFVGQGAARVRDLFDKAKKNSPCIIFIDEIDAVGKQRGASMDGGSDERAQTLNQLLTEMDGFGTDSGVVVMGASNRIDVLDDALLRPGRFDRHVVVGLPDRAGRIEILKVHARNKSFEEGVDFEIIARRTPGFSGADLANLLNEAAILSARDGRSTIGQDDVEESIERILVGPAKINSYMSEERKRLVAYHEAGHALVGAMLPEFDTVQKVSIVPRGGAAGLTWFAPPESVLDSGLYTFGYLKNQIAVALGGRIAEEMLFGPEGVTTGASNDLQKVTSIARQMVKSFGMGGGTPMNLDTITESMFIPSYSEETAKKIDESVERLVKDAYRSARNLLETHIDLLHEIANELILHETIEGHELTELIERHIGKTLGDDDNNNNDNNDNNNNRGDNPFRRLQAEIHRALDPWRYL